MKGYKEQYKKGGMAWCVQQAFREHPIILGMVSQKTSVTASAAHFLAAVQAYREHVIKLLVEAEGAQSWAGIAYALGYGSLRLMATPRGPPPTKKSKAEGGETRRDTKKKKKRTTTTTKKERVAAKRPHSASSDVETPYEWEFDRASVRNGDPARVMTFLGIDESDDEWRDIVGCTMGDDASW